MLIDQMAANNRWRHVSPAAKSIFSIGGLIAVFAVRQPLTAAGITLLLIATSLLGPGVGWRSYVRVAAPAALFMIPGCLSLAFSFETNPASGLPHIVLIPESSGPIIALGNRSLGALAALLFLVSSTPLNDLLGLLQRLKAPPLLLDIMLLCHRMLFVFSAACQSTHTAQAARLGYATPGTSLRSLGELAASLSLQIWQRAHDLHLAAQARNNDGPLRFIEKSYANTRRDCLIAVLASSLLILTAIAL